MVRERYDEREKCVCECVCGGGGVVWCVHARMTRGGGGSVLFARGVLRPHVFEGVGVFSTVEVS